MSNLLKSHRERIRGYISSPDTGTLHIILWICKFKLNVMNGNTKGITDRQENNIIEQILCHLFPKYSDPSNPQHVS